MESRVGYSRSIYAALVYACKWLTLVIIVSLVLTTVLFMTVGLMQWHTF
jgi:hypothetical protein